MNFRNFSSLLNPENFVELNSVTLAHLVLELFVGVKNYESKLCIMHLLQAWAVKSHTEGVLNWAMFHILVLKLRAWSASATKKPGSSD